MRFGRRIVLLVATVVWTTGLSAAVYKSVDAEGNVVYTDEPTGDAKPLKLPPLSTVPAPASSPARQTSAEQEKSAEAEGYQRISIVSPGPDATIRDNTGAVPVNVEVEPELNSASGHRFRYYLDGEAQGNATESAHISFHNVDRGTHTVEVGVVDSAGEELIRSGAVQFHLHRQSINFPRGPAAPAPTPRTAP
jgi:hypothetical protein